MAARPRPGQLAHRPRRVVIMGAAGRDFHNFNTVFRDDPSVRVVAFTAAQIPDIAGRVYPSSLAGPHYPRGIAIYPEEELPALIRRRRVEWVYLSYSDLPHEEVMHKASLVLAAGANFGLLGPHDTMLQARVPVISICAVRTGAGKSPTSRRVVRFFRERGRRIAIVRHPMPYGDLEQQTVQRFAAYEDLERSHTTIEEREEYEPYLRMGVTVFAGVDYARILALAEQEAELLLWDGGNNDFPFFRPDLHIVLLDPHRAGHEVTYHPGEVNFRLADVLIINKVDSASPAQVSAVRESAARTNPRAVIVEADLALLVDRPELIHGRRVLVVEDGPTLTHGEMAFGAGILAAQRHGAREIVEGRRWAMGSLRQTFERYPHLQRALPAMGYSPAQVLDLEATINAADCDVVIDATPVDLSRIMRVKVPMVNVEYELVERGRRLQAILRRFERRHLAQAQ